MRLKDVVSLQQILEVQLPFAQSKQWNDITSCYNTDRQRALEREICEIAVCHSKLTETLTPKQI